MIKTPMGHFQRQRCEGLPKTVRCITDLCGALEPVGHLIGQLALGVRQRRKHQEVGVSQVGEQQHTLREGHQNAQPVALVMCLGVGIMPSCLWQMRTQIQQSSEAPRQRICLPSAELAYFAQRGVEGRAVTPQAMSGERGSFRSCKVFSHLWRQLVQHLLERDCWKDSQALREGLWADLHREIHRSPIGG